MMRTSVIVPTPRPPRRALLVARKGPARDAIARLLGRVPAEVECAGDPFDATARFAERPADLVVVSLSGWRRRDLGFLGAVRRRGDATAVLALVPDRHRDLAAAALAAGADAYLPEPPDLGELDAVARRLLSRTPTAPPAVDPALASLASQVGHAVNNPLQVLSLLVEEGGGDPRTARLRDGVRAEAARIRDAVEIVAAYGRLGTATPVRLDVGAVLTERLARFTDAGLLAPAAAVAAHRADAPDPGGPVETRADPAQLREAVDALLRFLAGACGRRPAPLRARARLGRTGRPSVEVSARVEGLRLDEARVQGALGSVLEVDDATRVPYPGLAVVAAVARAHGGTVRTREGRLGTIFTLTLPR